MKIPEFSPTAKQDLDDAFLYYENKEAGLGFDFLAAVEFAVAQIARHPNSFVRFSKRSRKCVLTKFPYSLLYKQTDDTLVLVAIIHHKRNPETLKNRDK